MKVLYLSGFFWPQLGGIETLSLEFLPAMQKRGYEFMVITSLVNRDLPAYDNYEGIPVHRFPFLKAISEKNLPLMKDCILAMSEAKKTFRPELVHVQMSAPISFYHVKTLNAYPAPTLLSLHTCFGDYSAGKDTVLGQTLRTANWTTTVSNAVMSDVKKIYPEISEQSSVVYNGMKYSNVSPTTLKFSPPHILGIGRLVKEKGFDILIDAFALLREKFPEARLTLAGDGTKREALEKQVLNRKLHDSVGFTGQIHPRQISELINRGDVVVIPSRFKDPLPTVALEAGLLGRPVVGAKLGGLKEMIIEGKTGLLVDSENPQSYFEAIAHLITRPERAQSMGQSARSRIKNVFGWARYIDSYDDLYQQVVGGK